MEELISRLLKSTKDGNFEETDSIFLSFVDELKKSIQQENKKSFFSRFFQRPTNFPDGLKYLRRCLEGDVFSHLSYVVLVRSVNEIFPFFMNQNSPQEIYKESYILYLDVLTSLSDVLKQEDLVPFGNILYRSTFLITELNSQQNSKRNITQTNEIATNSQEKGVQNNERSDILQNQTPEYIESDHFIHELVNLLLNYFSSKGDLFDYWWSLLCTSILPPLTQSPSYNKLAHQGYFIPPFVERYDFNDFQLFKIFDPLLVSLMKKKNDAFFWFPDIFLRVCFKVFSSKPYYIDHFFDHIESEALSQIFQKSIEENVDLQCVSHFLVTCFNYVGLQFKNQNNNSAEYLKAKHMFRFLVFNVWKLFSDRSKTNAQAIISYITEELIHNPHHFLLFTILLLLFVSGISHVPDKIVASISQMDTYMKSSFSAFSCILGCIFAHQYLNIEKSFVLPCDMDCITYLVHHMDNTEIISKNVLPETMKIIRGIFVTADETKSRDESMEYIDMFFKSWENNEGLLIAYSCFTDTLVSIIRTLPNDYKINVLEIFSDFILRFLGLCESVQPPHVILTCVTTIVNIFHVKNTFLIISPSISTKLTLALLRLMSLDDMEISFKGVELSCKAILSGCPTFFACCPFIIHYLSHNIEIMPTQEILSIIVACGIFFRKYPTINKNVAIIENRLAQFLPLSKDKISTLANDYFIHNQKSTLKISDNASTALICDILLASLWKKHRKSMEIFSAAITLTHCLISAGFEPRQELLQILFLGANLKADKIKIKETKVETLDSENQITLEHVHSQNHSNMHLVQSSDAFLLLRKKENPFLQSLILGLDCLVEIIGSSKKIIPKFYTDLVEDLEYYFYEKQDVSILFLITNILIVSGEYDKLISFYKTLETKIPDKFDVFCDLIMLYLGKFGKVSPSSWQCISLDGAIAIGLTSQRALQVIEAAGDLPVVVSTNSSSRSAYTFSLVQKEKEHQQLAVNIKYDPKFSKKNENSSHVKPKNEERNQENDQINHKESDAQITNEFEIFIDIRNAIMESDKKYLLSSPKDITDSNSEISEPVSPISSDANSVVSLSLKDSLGIDFDATFAALKSLCLFGEYGFEASLPQDFRDLSSILSKQWKDNSHIPVFYSPFNSKDLQESMKRSWKEVPTMFQQFCSSLGAPSKNGTMVYHSTWGADISFEILPIIRSTATNGENTSLYESSMNKKIQIVWFEREITHEKCTSPNLFARICILPLKCGLIRVHVITKNNTHTQTQNHNSLNIEFEIHKFGPLLSDTIVCPESLPALIRSTVATLISKSSPLFAKSKMHSYERDNAKIRKIFHNIIIQESQH